MLRFVAFVAIFVSLAASADFVTPSDRVVSSIPIREEARGDARVLARLNVGEQAELLDAVPRWYRIELSDGTVGYVSKAWSTVHGGGTREFAVHFVDVGTGDGIIIDMGDREIVIDGGWEHTPLAAYAEAHDLIQWPIELVIVTHGDYDHWNGLRRLLGFDGVAPKPQPSVLEFWEPGYDRDCKPLASYEQFLNDMRAINGINFRRPLRDHHVPLVEEPTGQSFTMNSLPGVVFTLLHADPAPTATNGVCSFRINNASIVLMIEIYGHRFLFTGDANGKEYTASTPGHVEAKLLALEQQRPGILNATVIKVPHHGSESASTQNFVDKVNPEFAIISSSTRHHLPKESVVERYEHPTRSILRTDVDRRYGNDHIICFETFNDTNERVIDCNYRNVIYP
jgi:competence protein ComEC